MAVLIPSIGSCTFDSGGERRLAERLEAKLEDDPLLVQRGARAVDAHPDFIVFHPRRGLLILEVKDWRTRTILADRQKFTIETARGPTVVENPLEQARHYAHAATDVLQRDPQLVFSSGREAGKLMFPMELRRRAAEPHAQAVRRGRGGRGDPAEPGDLPGRDARRR